jgi:RecB family endonuclease NucS
VPVRLGVHRCRCASVYTGTAREETCPGRTVVSLAMRLIVARCEVRYSGRLNAVLPESTRLLILKSDGSVLVHADAGGYKPLNSSLSLWPTA